MAYEVTKVGKYTVCGPRHARLVVLMDSIAWTRPYTFWVNLCLATFQDVFSMPVRAICIGGARVLNGDYKKMYEEVMLKERCQYILVVALGNDVYKLGAQSSAYYSSFGDQLVSLKEYGEVGLVFGGSSSIWGYTDDVYDYHVRRVCAECRKRLVYVSAGLELQGVETADCIGHVRARSSNILFNALVSWMRGLVRVRSKL